jgi:hypothetical protein
MAEDDIEVDDVVVDKLLVLDCEALLVLGRLATMWPVSSRNTPVPSSQQVGALSQQ